MTQAPPRHARALVRELGSGARCVVRYHSSGVAAYLERHGIRTPIDDAMLEQLVVGGYLAAHGQAGDEQSFRLTRKGRRAYRLLARPGWQRRLPWTPLQRLQLALLPLCWLLGMVATVVLGELGLPHFLTTLGNAGAMLLPLLAAYAWQRWR